MIFILIKLYNDQNNEISLFNILNHFAIEENLNFFFNTTEKQYLFKDLVEDYNNNYSVLREKLIKRRNNWQVHISRIILDKKKSLKNWLIYLQKNVLNYYIMLFIQYVNYIKYCLMKICP